MTALSTAEDLDLHVKDLNEICRMCGWDCPLDDPAPQPVTRIEWFGRLRVDQPVPQPKPRKTP